MTDPLDHEFIQDDLLASAFDNEPDGYIMIVRPKYKWFPARLGRWFPKMMVYDQFSVRLEETENPDVLRMKRREEKE